MDHLPAVTVTQLLDHLVSLKHALHSEVWSEVCSHATHQFPSSCTQVVHAGMLHHDSQTQLSWQTCGWMTTPVIGGLQYELRGCMTYQVRTRFTNSEGTSIRDSLLLLGDNAGCSIAIHCRPATPAATHPEVSTRVFVGDATTCLSEERQRQLAPLGHYKPLPSRTELLAQRRRYADSDQDADDDDGVLPGPVVVPVRPVAFLQEEEQGKRVGEHEMQRSSGPGWTCCVPCIPLEGGRVCDAKLYGDLGYPLARYENETFGLRHYSQLGLPPALLLARSSKGDDPFQCCHVGDYM